MGLAPTGKRRLVTAHTLSGLDSIGPHRRVVKSLAHPVTVSRPFNILARDPDWRGTECNSKRREFRPRRDQLATPMVGLHRVAPGRNENSGNLCAEPSLNPLCPRAKI